MHDLAHWNRCRFDPAGTAGHYESWFQRANHASRPLAFWIRYTIFSPKGRPADAVGELWAIWFDGERGRTIAVKQSVPIVRCGFSATGLDARIGASTLTPAQLQGEAASGGHVLRWQLDYGGTEAPLLLLAPRLYEGGFPKAKALVGVPNARYHGHLEVDGERIAIDAWQGSQNHNWGSRHTDSYAWGQVAGFDDAPDAFLECSTARVRIGPLRTPPLTVLVLRVDGQEFSLNRPWQSLRATGRYDGFDWHIVSRAPGVCIRAHLHAAASAAVALRYADPPGGAKTCLNTKLAACEVVLERAGRPTRTLTARNRAAFEILTEREEQGVEFAA